MSTTTRDAAAASIEDAIAKVSALILERATARATSTVTTSTAPVVITNSKPTKYPSQKTSTRQNTVTRIALCRSSSWVSDAMYIPNIGLVVIRLLNMNIWEYHDVPYDLWDALASTAAQGGSVGGFLHRHLKDYRKVIHTVEQL